MAADQYADVLLTCWFFVTDGVLAEDDVVMVAANDDGGLFLFVTGAVVQYDVSLEAIAMGTRFNRFVAKLDSM